MAQGTGNTGESSQGRSTHSVPLEDYALLSDLRTGPLVSRDGSVDWLCFPDFDSAAVFSAVLGGPDDGRWRLSIVDGAVRERSYRGSTFVLDTRWEAPGGSATVTDVLPVGANCATMIRLVACTHGSVRVRHDLSIRPDYNRAGAWVRRVTLPEGGQGIVAIAGPEMLVLRGPLLDAHDAGRPETRHTLLLEGEPDPVLTGEVMLEGGQRAAWVLGWGHSYDEVPGAVDVDAAVQETERFWQEWSERVEHTGERAGMVERSLLVLRALTHERTGGIVAAPTTSLPEEFGGSRNWDYRYTWLRDAALTVEALIMHGYTSGARLWRDWLLRAVAADTDRLQIMYGVDGRRELPERELDQLAGYEGSRPVRIGNAAVEQYQADVVGETMLALAALRDAGEPEDHWSWGLQKHLLAYCVDNLERKDHGIWEMRGEKAYFTHGRVMMWAAFNEGLRAVDTFGADEASAVSATPAEIEQWTRVRDELRQEILTRGWNEELGSFVQMYAPAGGFEEVDASLLQLPPTRFIAADDPKMLGTVGQIERDLLDEHGFLKRYRTASGLDGLEGHEYPFLICMGWLGEQYAGSGRLEDAARVLDLLDGCASDLGLLAEEFDPVSGRLAGNFPQAFSHLGYIRAADALDRARG